jgi:hypothetical protein
MSAAPSQPRGPLSPDILARMMKEMRVRLSLLTTEVDQMISKEQAGELLGADANDNSGTTPAGPAPSRVRMSLSAREHHLDALSALIEKLESVADGWTGVAPVKGAAAAPADASILGRFEEQDARGARLLERLAEVVARLEGL